MDTTTTAEVVKKVKPTVGRMVYYKSRGSADGVYPAKDRAAVVTDVRLAGGEVEGPAPVLYQTRLTVFNPEGLFFTDWLDQGQEPGQWDWMPFQKDQMARMAPGTVNESHTGGSTGTAQE